MVKVIYFTGENMKSEAGMGGDWHKARKLAAALGQLSRGLCITAWYKFSTWIRHASLGVTLAVTGVSWQGGAELSWQPVEWRI